jgi:hypothetical protein
MSGIYPRSPTALEQVVPSLTRRGTPTSQRATPLPSSFLQDEYDTDMNDYNMDVFRVSMPKGSPPDHREDLKLKNFDCLQKWVVSAKPVKKTPGTMPGIAPQKATARKKSVSERSNASTTSTERSYVTKTSTTGVKAGRTTTKNLSTSQVSDTSTTAKQKSTGAKDHQVAKPDPKSAVTPKPPTTTKANGHDEKGRKSKAKTEQKSPRD